MDLQRSGIGCIQRHVTTAEVFPQLRITNYPLKTLQEVVSGCHDASTALTAIIRANRGPIEGRAPVR